MIDLNNSGQISISEVKQLMKNLNLNVDFHVIEKVFRKIDQNKDGKIQFEEFLNVIKKHHSKKSDVKAIFSAIDVDNSGYITFDEMYKAAKKLNPTISKHEIEQEMNKIDLDGNRKICLDGKLKGF